MSLSLYKYFINPVTIIFDGCYNIDNSDKKKIVLVCVDNTYLYMNVYYVKVFECPA